MHKNVNHTILLDTNELISETGQINVGFMAVQQINSSYIWIGIAAW